MSNKVKVIKESKTGANQKFQDTKTKETMTKSEFVKAIEKGKYDDYHIMNKDGKKIPRSNPDKTHKNNLG